MTDREMLEIHEYLVGINKILKAINEMVQKDNEHGQR